MKKYVVCVSDASGADRRTEVIVDDQTDVSHVAQLAIDDYVAFFAGRFEFPLFLDIHHAEQFHEVGWPQPPARLG